MWRWLLLFFGAIWAGLVFAEQDVPTVKKLEIISAEFGVFYTSDAGEQVFEPSGVVPHKVGQRYGWVIEVRSGYRSLGVREEYLLASLRKNEENDADVYSDNFKIHLPRRSQVSQRQLVPVDGKILGEWAVGVEEPAGRRHLQVFVENQLAADFEFEVK